MSHADGATEQWRPIPGFEGAYEVSNLGRVRSLDRVIDHAPSSGRAGYQHIRRGKVLRPGRTKSGHLTVVLGREAGSRFVHSLVLLAFVGPMPQGQECRHLNGEEWDNRLANLEYATRSINSCDKKDHKGAVNYTLTSADVRKIRAELAHPYNGVGQVLARRFGVAASTISAIKTGVLHARTH